MKNKGFTLIESMIAITISGVVAVGGASYLMGRAEQTQIDALSSKLTNIVSAADQRVAVDRFEMSRWPAVRDYVTTVQVQEFLNREFIARTVNCGDSANGWQPVIDDPTDAEEVTEKENLRLVPCNVWGTTETELGMTASLTLRENSGNIQTVNLFLRFPTQEEFEDGFPNMRKVIEKARELDRSNITGSHNYELVDMSKPEPQENIVTTTECLDLGFNCGLMSQYDSDGNGFEALDVMGGNSMINSKVDFIEKVGDNVINSCFTFEFNTSTNIWERRDNVDCGFGIDPSKNNAFVEADIHSLAAERIFLNHECLMNVGGTNVTVPCGMFNTTGTQGLAGYANQAVAVLDEVQAEAAFVHLLNADEITTDTLTVDDTLTVGGKTTLNELEVISTATFEEKVTMEGALNEVQQNLKVYGGTTLDSLEVSSSALFEKDVQINGFLDVTNGFVSADHIKLDTISLAELNSNCPVEMVGAMKIYNNGSNQSEPVICSVYNDIDGNSKRAWKLANARIGQIVPFDGTCPDGYEYFEDSAGRVLIGQNKTLLDGKSQSQKNSLIAQGKVFTDAYGNILEYDVGDKGGEAFHVLTEDEMPRHNHKVPDIKKTCSGTDCAGFAMAQVGAAGDTVWSNSNEIPTGSAGSDKAHENRMPYYTVNYCIYSGK
jgi:prepilin-type N-terminal cleavage/methylation domain-containing protein